MYKRYTLLQCATRAFKLTEHSYVSREASLNNPLLRTSRLSRRDISTSPNKLFGIHRIPPAGLLDEILFFVWLACVVPTSGLGIALQASGVLSMGFKTQ